jgi:hypothetical protein
MNQKTILFAMLALILSFGFTRQVFAQYDDLGSPDFIKSRTYIGVMGISSTIDQWGDFGNGPGSTYLEQVTSGGATEVEADFVPSIERNFGFGVLIGHREGPWACEVSFYRSDHTSTYVESINNSFSPVTVTTPASLQSIDINFKRYFFTQLPTQPFINIGFSFPWLWVRQASYVAPPTLDSYYWRDDETYSGIGFDLGAGLEIYMDNDFSLLGGVFQRWGGFQQVNGGFKTPGQIHFDSNFSDPPGSMEGDGLTLYVGTTFGFQ